MVDFKTQTKRATNFKRDIININLFVNKDFEVGVVTSKYWGDFEERKEPLIELEIKGNKYDLPLSKFIELIEPLLIKEKREYEHNLLRRDNKL